MQVLLSMKLKRDNINLRCEVDALRNENERLEAQHLDHDLDTFHLHKKEIDDLLKKNQDEHAASFRYHGEDWRFPIAIDKGVIFKRSFAV